MPKPRLAFWYDFASTYSYLSAMRIEGLAAAAGVEIAWRPFLLGPIFQAQGWPTSPFNVYPAKGRYMVRDMGRIAASRGLPFAMPPAFPARSLAAARLALVEHDQDWTGRFSRAVFAAEFGRGVDIGEAAELRALVAGAVAAGQPGHADGPSRSDGAEVDAIVAAGSSAAIKEKLRLQTARAMELGVFGAPSFIADDGELFWGDDRLEIALRWAQQL